MYYTAKKAIGCLLTTPSYFCCIVHTVMPVSGKLVLHVKVTELANTERQHLLLRAVVNCLKVACGQSQPHKHAALRGSGACPLSIFFSSNYMLKDRF